MKLKVGGSIRPFFAVTSLRLARVVTSKAGRSPVASARNYITVEFGIARSFLLSSHDGQGKENGATHPLPRLRSPVPSQKVRPQPLSG